MYRKTMAQNEAEKHFQFQIVIFYRIQMGILINSQNISILLLKLQEYIF